MGKTKQPRQVLGQKRFVIVACAIIAVDFFLLLSFFVFGRSHDTVRFTVASISGLGMALAIPVTPLVLAGLAAVRLREVGESTFLAALMFVPGVNLWLLVHLGRKPTATLLY